MPVGSAVMVPKGSSRKWREALLRWPSPPHIVIHVSPLHAAHTHLPKHGVFTSLSLHFAYVNMPPKGAALGELVTKQPEITGEFAHKVGVKNLSLYVELILFKKLFMYLTRLIQWHVCISTCWINNINLWDDVYGWLLMARWWKEK